MACGTLGTAPRVRGDLGKKVFVGGMGIVGVAEWVAYFVDYKTPQGHPPLLPALGHIGTTTEYFLTLLGSALFWQAERAYAGGLVIGCLALAMLLATYGRGATRASVLDIPSFLLLVHPGHHHARARRDVRGLAGDRLQVHDLLDSLGGERLRDAGKDGIRHNGQRP